MRALRRPILSLGFLIASLSVASCALFGSNEVDGRAERRIRGFQGRPFGLGIAATGQALALQLDTPNLARFELTADSAQEQVPVGLDPIDVSFTADGGLAYVTLLEGDAVHAIDMATGAVVDSMTFGRRHHRILFSPDDGRFWVASTRGTVWAVDRASGTVLDSAVLGSRILRGLAHHAASDRLAVVGDGDLLLLDAATLDVVDSVTLGGYLAQDVAFSPDGARLYVALEDQSRVVMLDAATLALRDAVVFEEETFMPFAMRLSPNGDRLVVSSYLTGRVAILDPRTFRVRAIIRTGGGPRRVAFSPSGDRAFVTNQGGWVDVIR